jgi:hypothetical protein
LLWKGRATVHRNQLLVIKWRYIHDLYVGSTAYEVIMKPPGSRGTQVKEKSGKLKYTYNNHLYQLYAPS